MTKKKYKKIDTAKRTFSAEENTLLLYLREIDKIPLLSKEEEEITASRAAKGDKAAREKLVNANLRFVIVVAKKYQGKGLPLEDLIGEGNIGLLNSIKNYDATKGYRFITYAVWWIRQAIIKAIHEKGRMIRLPSNKTCELTRIEKTRQVIQNEPGWKANAEIRKIAMFLGISEERALALMQMNQEVMSLEDPISHHGYPLTIKDIVEDVYYNSPVEHAVNSILRDELETILDGLDQRAADVIRCRFGLGETGPKTLKEVGTHYQLSRERIRQIEKRALGQIQHYCLENKLESYIAS